MTKQLGKLAALGLAAWCALGCAGSAQREVANAHVASLQSDLKRLEVSTVAPVSHQEPSASPAETPRANPLPAPRPAGETQRGSGASEAETLEAAPRAVLSLEEVVSSVVDRYPLLRAALFGRNVAQGELQGAWGAFDTKLKADSLNMPLGFYENYRQSVGVEQPLFGGADLVGGYRIGRGDFPEWYGERQTKLGGEFKAGVIAPLWQDRRIDDRRAAVWRSEWEVQAVEPEIQMQLLDFVRVASILYWNWVAAERAEQIASALLRNAEERAAGLEKRVAAGDAPEIELVDNDRLIVSRRAKLIDAQRKVQQSALKLSLFMRDETGRPLDLESRSPPADFPAEPNPTLLDVEADIQTALIERPEPRALAILREQLLIELETARNLQLPQVDAVLLGSQDVGFPPDPNKDDKGPFELEGGLVGSFPLQRRKGRGKELAVRGKLAQVAAKAEFTLDKIIAEVRVAHVALVAAYTQLSQARRSVELAREMEAAERRRFDLGDSNLLLVNLREQATADAAQFEVDAQLSYFEAQADYRAAIAAAPVGPRTAAGVAEGTSDER